MNREKEEPSTMAVADGSAGRNSFEVNISPQRKKSMTKEEKRDISLTILCYSYAVRELCLEYKRDVPTVIKLIYDAKTRQERAQYGYERLKSLSEYDDNARCRMWFDEIRAKNL